MEFALGGVYDQLKRPKDAIDAYKRAVDLDPEDAHNLAALAQALLNDNQLDAALKQYRQLADADPQDSSTTVHISEILRRQGKYEEALTTIKKAVKKDPDSSRQATTKDCCSMFLAVMTRLPRSTNTWST